MNSNKIEDASETTKKDWSEFSRLVANLKNMPVERRLMDEPIDVEDYKFENPWAEPRLAERTFLRKRQQQQEDRDLQAFDSGRTRFTTDRVFPTRGGRFWSRFKINDVPTKKSELREPPKTYRQVNWPKSEDGPFLENQDGDPFGLGSHR